MRDVLVVTVQFRNPDDTAALIFSLSQCNGAERCNVAIVDNDEKAPENLQLYRSEESAPFPIEVLRPGQNLYYWGGAAHALSVVNEASYRWVVICNNDVTIDDPAFLDRLMEIDGVKHPIIAPSIISTGTGIDQNPLLRAPAGMLKRFKWRIYDIDYRIAKTMLMTHSVLMRVAKPISDAFRSKTSPSEGAIYAPHGAFVILSTEFFARGGSLDTTVPMFAEELSLAATASRLGIAVWYDPHLRVLHNPHSTTGASLTPAKYDLERLARRHYFKLVDTEAQ